MEFHSLLMFTGSIISPQFLGHHSLERVMNDLVVWKPYEMQHDAACRVIARLRIERDEARDLLLKAERQVPSTIAAPAPAAPTVTSNGKRGELNKFVYLLLFDFVL